MEQAYLQSVIKQFEYYKFLGERTFDQLDDNQILWQYNEASNSIAVTVNHLSGNMKSRWTDFLTTDGEKEWRNRDEEFEDIVQSKEALLKRWNEGWTCLFKALKSVNTENFYTEIYIRNQSHGITEAINRQLAHYSYHIGQIVYVGRMIKGNAWKNLSIPKGKSQSFNNDKFSRGKHGGHYTDR